MDHGASKGIVTFGNNAALNPRPLPRVSGDRGSRNGKQCCI